MVDSVQEDIVLQCVGLGIGLADEAGFYDGHHRSVREVGRRYSEGGADEAKEGMMRSGAAAIDEERNVVFEE